LTLRVHYLQHASGEGPGAIEGWAAERGHLLAGTHAYRGDPLPGLDDFDLLVVLGGGMSVHDTDRHPWLAGEKRLLAAAIAAEMPVLGICLGSQLIADVLGAAVTRNPEPEIGWFPVRSAGDSPWARLFPAPAIYFHWHEDTWALPPGAVRLAGSAACGNQAFARGDRVVGVQFHPEMTPAIVASILAEDGASLPRGPFIQDPSEMLADEAWFAQGHLLLRGLLDELARRARVPVP